MKPSKHAVLFAVFALAVAAFCGPAGAATLNLTSGVGKVSTADAYGLVSQSEASTFAPADALFATKSTTTYDVMCGAEPYQLVNVVSVPVNRNVRLYRNSLLLGYDLTGFGDETEVNPAPAVGDTCTHGDGSSDFVSAVVPVPINQYHDVTSFAFVMSYGGIDRPMRAQYTTSGKWY